LAPGISSADSVAIQVHFLKGEWNEGERPFNQVEVFTATSRPEIIALREKMISPAAALKTAIIDTLLKIANLRTVEDLFWFEKPWREGVGRLAEAVSSNDATFLFVFVPKVSSSRRIILHTTVYKSGKVRDPLFAEIPLNKELMEALGSGKIGQGTKRILDTELELEIGDPTLVAIPADRDTYFMSIVLTDSQKASEKLEFPGGPKAVRTVIPLYPAELRQKGVEGQVELAVGIDKEGNVAAVKVTKSLHPFLDNAAVQALKQWKFEPVLRNGEPVPAIITTVVNFNAEVYKQQEAMFAASTAPSDQLGQSQSIRLKEILEGSAEYCRKLLESALDYICEETISDVFFNLASPEELKKSAVVLTQIGGADLITELGGTRYTAAKGKTERNKYVCDYLLIKRGDKIESSRIILKENGHPLPDRSRHLEEVRFSSLSPFLEPGKILGHERQKLFNFRVLKEDKINGKRAFVIEAVPKLGEAGGIEYGKIWVEKEDFKVLRMEVTGLPLEGYESVLKELAQYNLKSKFATTFQYRIEKKGVAFPSNVSIRVNYPFPGLEPVAYIVEKIRTDITYEKYKFFAVETKGDLKKSTHSTPRALQPSFAKQMRAAKPGA